jgi:serine protease Do
MRFSLVRITLIVALAVGTCTTLVRGTDQLADDQVSSRRSPIVIAIERAAPAVVDIRGNKLLTSNSEGGDGSDLPRKVNGMGTGIIIDPRGYILTNHHVVDGVRPIQVTLQDGTTYTARIVAHDARTDLAVIKVKPTNPLPLLPVGTSSDLMLGETVIAVGNAYGYQHTVTKGIISALHRTVEVTETQDYYDLIQTDASINPGNSGGPLLNIRGELVGINVAVRVGAQGIAFAIPVDKAMEVAAELIAAERRDAAWHGIEGRSEYEEGECRFIASRIASESPACAAGIRSGDCVRSINDISINRQLDVERALLGTPPGKPLSVVLDRPGRGESSVEIVLDTKQGGADGAREIPPTAEVDKLAWEVLGIRVTPVSADQLPTTREQFNGGLEISAIRKDGNAADLGIRVGDILIGMHGRETATLDHLDWILNKSDLENQDGAFLVIRGGKILSGNIRVARK